MREEEADELYARGRGGDHQRAQPEMAQVIDVRRAGQRLRREPAVRPPGGDGEDVHLIGVAQFPRIRPAAHEREYAAGIGVRASVQLSAQPRG